MDCPSAVETAPSRPNILLIVMDATRAKNLSCYGYQRTTTPNLERFAERCLVYEAAISPAGWSLPAHASIFTGLYPSRHGAHERHKYLPPEHHTMAEIMRSRGYQTLALCHNRYVGSATGLDRGFELFNPVVGSFPRSLRRMTLRMENGLATLLGRRDSGARYTNKQVSAALRRFGNRERPFFMYVHYSEPHWPYRPPRNYNRYLPDGVSSRMAKQINQDPWQYFVDPASMGGEDFEILTALYDGEITYLDTCIAEVLGWLGDSGLLDETMVIITADHGENIGDHRMMGHQYCLYDTLLHVPLIIHYPRGEGAGARIAHQVQTLDILPTILAMLGDATQGMGSSLQGLDLWSSSRHDFAIAEWEAPDLTTFHERFPGVDVSKYDRALKMIRTDRYKYIWASDGNHELYDLQADPNEARNVLGECPEVADNLDGLLSEWLASFDAAIPSDDAPEFDEEVKDRLRALGYLE